MRPRASIASLLSKIVVEGCRAAPHAVLQGAPAREAMPQKTTARQAHGAKITLEISGIALNTRRKIFLYGTRAKSAIADRRHRLTRRNLR
jgi:hypothetical protein